MKYFWLGLVLICVVAAWLRIYRLDQVPPHLSNDEISIAYDAYSLLKTGRDEHGQRLPLAFASHGMAKAPLYAYLAVPMEAIGGNTTGATRATSVVMGLLACVAIAGVAIVITGSKRVGLAAGVLLAITPWHIHASRMALESNVGLTLGLIGIWAFGLRRWYLGATLMALSVYSYHTYWGFAPLVMAWMGWKRRGQMVGPLMWFGLLVSPIAIDWATNPVTRVRAGNDLVWHLVSGQTWVEKIVDGIKLFLSHWLSHFNPRVWVGDGLKVLPTGDIYQLGWILLGTGIAFVVGLWRLRIQWLWVWLVLAPIVPALTQGEPSGTRALVMLPVVIIIAAKGTVKWPGLWVVCLIGLGWVWLVYFNLFPQHGGVLYQYGYEQTAKYVQKLSTHNEVIFDPRFGETLTLSGVPHLYLAYYLKIDPRDLQQRQISEGTMKFGRFQQRDINWNAERPKTGDIYIVSVANLPPKDLGLEELQAIDYPDGKPHLRVYQAE